MKHHIHPNPKTWKTLLTRPTYNSQQLESKVQTILQAIQQEGDQAIKQYTRQFDQVVLEKLQVMPSEFKEAAQQVSPALKQALQTAKANLEQFHQAQQTTPTIIETMEGVRCWRKNVAIDKVGLYIPGGTAPLFSTVLMLGIPAQIAGCQEIILCSPPQKDGRLHPAILYAAQLVGINKVFKIGGVQAIGAMAYGTKSVPAVYKIFGPGNQYVTAAKQLVHKEGIAIDMPAGPSEVLVVADETANPAFVAADLLSQAEHGADSQVVLVTFTQQLVEAVETALEKQLVTLPRKTIAQQALANSLAIVVQNKQEALALINEYAPEHLIVALAEAATFADQITNAGSVFIGNYSPESVGDYASGTNHTLPTNGFAKTYSGVSLDSFVKKITFQQLTKEGLHNIGKTVITMAQEEQLMAHSRAVEIRLDGQ